MIYEKAEVAKINYSKSAEKNASSWRYQWIYMLHKPVA